MPDPNAERLSTWIDKDVLHVLRIYSTIENQTQRNIIEMALRDYFDKHPLDLKPVHELIEQFGAGTWDE